jgi:hypothetical protein
MQHDDAQHRWSAALVPTLFPSLSLLHIMLLQMQMPFAVGVSLTTRLLPTGGIPHARGPVIGRRGKRARADEVQWREAALHVELWTTLSRTRRTERACGNVGVGGRLATSACILLRAASIAVRLTFFFAKIGYFAKY